MFGAMRRVLILGCLLSSVLVFQKGGIEAQDASSRAAAIADKQDSEERYRRLSSTVEDLLASQAVLQKRISAINDELRSIREEHAKPNTTYVTRDEIKRLAEQLQEIDRKREADKKLILEEIQKLAKIPVTPQIHTPPATSRQTDRQTEKPQQERIENGYWHVVEKDEILSVIVQAYRQKGIKVTRKMVEDANPGMNPNRLLRGQKIFIPDPTK